VAGDGLRQAGVEDSLDQPANLHGILLEYCTVAVEVTTSVLSWRTYFLDEGLFTKERLLMR
jgi:hypothetical protein